LSGASQAGLLRPLDFLHWPATQSAALINTGGGDDSIFVDYRRTFPAFSRIITVNLGAGSDSLVVFGNANYILNNTALSVSSGVSGRVNHSGVELAILQP